MARFNNVRTDRFGNAFTVVGCKDKKGKGYPVGYVELGGKLYKIEPSEANKEGIDMWVRITRVNKQNRQTSL